ncbi:hypothetical protein DB347_08375 [Opitutaceae bacterium EW11]|nr:hypothetical protein DB347_08375 [Opitutaceae bacterium EW11]
MPDNFTPVQIAMSAAEIVVLLIGLGVVWWVQFSRSGSAFRQDRLPCWAISLPSFGTAIVEAIGGGLVGMLLARLLGSMLPQAVMADAAFSTVVINAGLHLGVLGGVLLYVTTARESDLPEDNPPLPNPVHSRLSTAQAMLAGVLTFCATAAILLPVAFVWDGLLKRFGVPLQRQELIEIFAKADTPVKLAVMSAIAIVIAPMTEELTFRAGFFRFLRGRIPRWLTYLVPAAVFAALHNNVAVFAPLFVLGVVFSVSYERTGRILVPIIAHALFNLNTILLILIMGVNV